MSSGRNEVSRDLYLQEQVQLFSCCFSGYRTAYRKDQGSCLFVTYTIIQGIISSEMEMNQLHPKCKQVLKESGRCQPSLGFVCLGNPRKN